MRNASARYGAAGFALVDLLLAVSLTAFITAFIAGGLSFGTRALEKGRTIADTRSAELIEHMVANWISGALAASRLSPDGAETPGFRGTSGDLAFTALSDGRTQHGGLVSIRLATVADRWTGSDDAVVRTAVFRRAALDAPPATSIVLEGHASFEFSYFGATGGDVRPRWHDGWNGIVGLPTLVAFRIKRKGSPGRAARIVRLRNGEAITMKLPR